MMRGKMFVPKQKMCILVYIFVVIMAPVLVVFADATGSTRATASELVVPALATATTTPTPLIGTTLTTTLASSNAPATTINDDVEETESSTTTLPVLEPNDKSGTTFGGATSTSTDVTEAPTMDFESKSRAGPAVVDHRRNGNEARIQIKNAKEQPTTLRTARTTTTTYTNTMILNEKSSDVTTEGKYATDGTNDGDVGAKENVERNREMKTTNGQEATTIVSKRADQEDKYAKETHDAEMHTTEESSSRKMEAELATTITTGEPTKQHNFNEDVHVERELSNGLYRIKLAEIVTDEFSGTHEVSESMHTTEQPKEQHHYRELLANTVGSHQTQSNTNLTSNVNIVDLYPMKMEDFKPIIRDSNAKLLKERTIYTRRADDDVDVDVNVNAAEHHQNLMPNEVDDSNDADDDPAHTMSLPRKTVNHTPTYAFTSGSSGRRRGDSISDFTGKLLAEQDGVITEIEQKFQLNEFVAVSEPTSTQKTRAHDVPNTATDVGLNDSATAATTAAPSTSTATTFASPIEKAEVETNAKFVAKASRKQHYFAGGSGGVGRDFIERRVKKSFDFPMHRAASDVMSVPHIDFANTKFNTDNSGNAAASGSAAAATSAVADGSNAAAVAAGANPAHPEFSTTKFYNSKELYNEMLQHNKQQHLKVTTSDGNGNVAKATTTSRTTNTGKPSLSSPGVSVLKQSSGRTPPNRFVALLSPNLKSFKKTKDFADPIDVVTTTEAPPLKPVTLRPTKSLSSDDFAALASATTLKPQKFQKELKRAKLLLKAMMLPPSNSNSTTTTTTTTAIHTDSSPSSPATIQSATFASSPSLSTLISADNILNVADATISSLTNVAAASSTLTPQSTTTELSVAGQSKPPITITTPIAIATVSGSTATVTSTSTDTVPAAASTSSSAHQQLEQHQHHRVTNPTKPTSKPIARPRILSRLQEKINSLECEIQNVPQDSHLWRGNETHELLLPVLSSAHCQTSAASKDCTPLVTSWEGEAEIQSGDILIVEINDASLGPNERIYTNSAHTTQVYQVTRSGHEHCDVTEGILLDITPLVVDGRKLVTLYDKDLTEGVNLLIVVSELWGTQCVRLKVTAKTDNCGENADCSGKGVCFSNAAMEEYECQCCSGFAGPHCEEIDACTPSPCTNNGICVDLSQGHEGNSYQCLCPYGYTGKNCQYESDPCNPAECLNGGSCVGNSTHFRCDCTAGYAGPLCQHSLNECESSPCVHGICVDQEDGFRCFCQPGFAGELCNFEYNECESNPCQNSGECIDHIGSYECRCTKGYTGNRCQIKVDFCANKPCPEGHRCIDHGNDFGCECPGGRNGPDCNQMPRTQCNVNPCTHGGTCWSSGDSFYCACRPGYTGTMCEDEFVVETVVSSSEFMVDDTSARNFNDKTFGSSVVLKSPIELHNAYFAAGVLAAAIFIVAIVVTICHCKVNQTYRKFSTRSTTFFPILGFGRRPKSQNKLNKHWLSGKGLGNGGGSGNPLRASSGGTSSRGGSGGGAGGGGHHHHHLPATGSTALHHSQQQQQHQQQQQLCEGGPLHERPFQRHLAMNLENDMYYTVDFSDNSQHSPLIQ